MPHSDPHGKTWAVEYYQALQPAVVVEAGPGAGMWSRALRPFHAGIWIGVEVWEPYVERYGLLPYLYDRVVISDIRDYVVPDQAGLVIAGDVLEHVPQSDAWELVEAWKEQGLALLISTPIVRYEQGALEGNVHETHLWHPTHEEMLALVEPDHFTTGDVVGCYWRDPR